MLEYSGVPAARESGAKWSWIEFDLDGVRSSLLDTSGRLAPLIQATDDPHRRADALDWSLAETAAHLLVVTKAYRHYAEGKTESVLDLDRLAETNQARIDEIGQRGLDELANAMETAVAGLVTASQGREAIEVVPFHSATTLPLGALLAVCLGELLVHGRDIARALRRPWPLSADDAVHVIRGGFAVTPLVVDRKLAAARPATYRVRSKGLPQTTWRFADGTLEVGLDAPAKVDCHMSVDPVTWMLICYGRMSAMGAAIRGRALSWGRKPWAGFRFRSYFTST